MLALLPARDTERQFTPVAVSGALLEPSPAVQLGESESEVGVDEAMRGQFTGENRDLGDICVEKFRNCLAEWRERTPPTGASLRISRRKR